MSDGVSSTSFFGWLAAASLLTWITTIYSLRKDERSVVIENITKERKEWRINLRKWCAEVSELSVSTEWDLRSYYRLKSELVTRLNPVDKQDYDIIHEYEKLKPINEQDSKECLLGVRRVLKVSKTSISNNENIVEVLQKKVGCLLKDDWEMVKYECAPFYKKWFSEETFKKRIIAQKGLFLTLKDPYSNSVKKGDIFTKFDFEIDVSGMYYNKFKSLPFKSSLVIVFILVCIWLPVKFYLSIHAFNYDYLRIGLSVIFLLFSGVLLDYYVFTRSIYKNTNIFN